jgi:hypothetical protein
MNYNSFPREWVFRDRKFIDEFVVKGQTLNAQLFNHMQGLPMFRDEMDAEACMLQCFNNAYYISILILKDDFPQLSIAKYSSIAYGQRKWKFQTDVHALTLGIVCNLLKYSTFHSFSATNYIQQSFSDVINNDNCIDLGPRQIFNHMINGIEHKNGLLYYDLSPRPIEDIIYSSNSLKRYLTIDGDVVCEAVRVLCYDDKQRLKLIERLLEPEKEHYGFMDAQVCNTYRMLHELRSQITGEPLPKKMPFDNVTSYAPPSGINPPSYSEDSKRVKELEAEVRRLNRVEAENKILKGKLKELEQSNQTSDEIDKLKKEVESLRKEGHVSANAYEKIIFFATVLSAAYDSRFTNQTALSELICLICGGSPSTFQPRISNLAKNADASEKDKEKEKEIKNAAIKLVKKLMKVPKEVDKDNPKINEYIESIKSEFEIREEDLINKV